MKNEKTKKAENPPIVQKIQKEMGFLLSDGVLEQAMTKKVLADKNNYQFSLKIPKNLATKSLLDNKSEFRFVFNPSEETLKKIRKAKLVIYLKE